MIIGICDNELHCLDQAEKVILNYAKETGLDVELRRFQSGDQLLSYHGAPMEVLFMDIELNNQSGIELAQKVNQNWPNCQIVYLTNYLFYATEVYSTAHSFYVLKDQFTAKVHSVFQKVFHELQQQEAKLIFNVIGGSEVVLAPNEIFYFERVRRTTVIVTTWGEYVIWDRISDIMNRLPKLDFVRCHNSYIVYLPAVREMQRSAFIMNNGVKISISRSHSLEAKEAFTQWALTQIP